MIREDLGLSIKNALTWAPEWWDRKSIDPIIEIANANPDDVTAIRGLTPELVVLSGREGWHTLLYQSL